VTQASRNETLDALRRSYGFGARADWCGAFAGT
jgi:hypothetical protein